MRLPDRLVAPPAARRGLVVVYAGVVLFASVIDPPSAGTAPGGPFGLGADKWLHAATYAALAILLAYAALARTSRALLAVVVLAAGYGAGIEVVQSFLPLRSFEATDMAANAIGAAAAVGIWTIAGRVFPRLGSSANS